MTDHELIRSCDEAVQRERDALADVLRHLREIDRRRLFSELNYKSLFDYCVRRLGYSEDQAYRRISAMRLIKQLPEAEAKIEEGTLSLSNASLLQRAISQGTLKLDSKDHEGKEFGGQLSKPQILELINKVENKSRREAEKILIDAKATLHIQVSDKANEKFQSLRGLTAHKYKNVSELFDAMVDLALDEKHGLLPRKYSLAQKQRIMASSKGETQAQTQSQTQTPNTQSTVGSKVDDPKAEVKTSTSAQTTSEAPISDTISLKASSFKSLKCTRCGSTHALQTEHIVPRAKGGSDDLKNLTLLCRNCNQRAAIREFGQRKMDKYLQRDPKQQ